MPGKNKMYINDQTVGDEPQAPFGGVKDSGWGRFGGNAALEEFTLTLQKSEGFRVKA